MLEVGDIVRPKSQFNGNDMLFYVDRECESSSSFSTQYILRPFRTYPGLSKDVKWNEGELLLIASKSWVNRTMQEKHMDLIEIENMLMEEQFGNTEKTIDDSIASITYVSADHIDLSTSKITLTTDGIENIMNCNYNEKENDYMKILDIYKERKEKELSKEYDKKREELMAKDTIQNIFNEMQDQVNAILEEEDFKGRFRVYEPEMVTKETQKELEKIGFDVDNKRIQLHSTLEEIRALFEMTEDYQERMKILKRYGIIGKDGKLNV